MSNTIERAIRSCMDQVDDRFEMLVVDDGSTDGSVEIINSLCDEYPNLRLIALKQDSARKLGETRNVSIREAKGKYVFPQIDADDRYDRIPGCFNAFVKLYHQIEEQLEYDFYLSGRKLHIGKRDFLLNRGPFRNLPPGGEDRDLWRRLLAEDCIIFLQHKKSYKPNIGHHKDRYKKLNRSFYMKKSDFQTGITLTSYMRWNLRNASVKKLPYHMVANPLAYVVGKLDKIGKAPRPYTDICIAEDEIQKAKKMTANDIEDKFDICIDRTEFNDTGSQMLFEFE